MRTPVNGLKALVDVTPLVHFAEDANLTGFVLGLQRKIRVVPISPHAEALKIFALNIDKTQRIITTPLPKLKRRELMPIHARFFDNLLLDRQAVRVPSRNVGHPVAILGA